MCIFRNRRIRTVGALIGAAAVVLVTVLCLLDPPVYSTDVMGSGGELPFDGSYTVSLADARYGDVSIRYEEAVEDYFLHAEFRRSGDTVLTVVSPSGGKTEYDLHIERDTYALSKRSAGEQSG